MTALDPPNNLDAASKQVWRDTVTAILEAGTITHLNVPSLAAYVAAVANHRRATLLLTQTDVLINRDGKASANPALAIQTQAANTIATFARQFRLNSGGAGPIDAPGPKSDRDDHPGTWCDEHHRWECRANKSRGRGECHAIATSTGRCPKHMGGPEARAKKLASDLVRPDTIALGVTYGEPLRITPEAALVGELWRTAGHVKWLGDRVSELEASALTWGTTQTVSRWWGEFPGSETVQKAGPHILLDLYDRERKHLVHVASEIIKAGLAQRLLSQAQEQGAAYARALDLILRDLDLTPEQWRQVPAVVPARLRELMPA